MKEPQFCDAFILIANLHQTLGHEPLNRYRDCWELQVDDHWFIAVNGNQTPRKNSMGDEVAPFNAMIYFNGWCAGYFDPRGGIIAAGTLANEDTFIAALQAAIAKTRR